MRHPLLSRILLASVALGTAAALASCTTDANTPQESAATPPAPSPEPDAAADDEEPEQTEAPPETLTCETLLSGSLVSSLKEVGWTAQSEDFNIGGLVLDGGIRCTWGDYTVASDHVQIYGWAPIDESEASAAQQQLLDEGWLRADGGEGVYFTEPEPMQPNIDEDGYGMTYQFGDGWVAVADTMQGLLLIQRP